MSVITDVWRQLVRRRLWPVAVLLLGALVAVPVLLATSPAAVPAPALPTSSSTGDAAATPVVALADATESARRHVLGDRKDPFRPAAAAVAKVRTASASGSTPATAAPSAGGSTTVSIPNVGSGTTTGGSSGGTATPPSSSVPPSGSVPPAATTPSAPRKTYELYALTVRFGDATSTEPLAESDLNRLQALPSADDPAVAYLGVEDGGRTAVFMVDSSVDAQGDGRCDPSPADCETVRLREGETEFFDVKDDTGAVTAQYELDLVKIHRSTTASAAKAAAARAKSSKAGRRIVRARSAKAPLRWVYDLRTGTVHKLRGDVWKAAVARAARAAH